MPGAELVRRGRGRRAVPAVARRRRSTGSPPRHFRKQQVRRASTDSTRRAAAVRSVRFPRHEGGDGHERAEPGGSCRSVERSALEDGGVRLDRVRRRSRWRWARRRRDGDEVVGDRERRVAPRRADPRPGNFDLPARESVLVQSRTATVDDPAFPVGRRRRRPDALPAAGRHQHRLAEQPTRRRPDLARPPLGARPVRRQGQGRGRGEQDRADPRRDRRRPGRLPERDHRGVRPGLRRPPAQPARSRATWRRPSSRRCR